MAKVEKGIVFTSNSVIDYAEGGVGRALFNRPATRSFYLIGVKPIC